MADQPLPLCHAHEKRMKRWRHEWTFVVIEYGNLDWRDRSEPLMQHKKKRDPGSRPG